MSYPSYSDHPPVILTVMPHSSTDFVREIDAFFMNVSPIHQTMDRLVDVFDELHIPFAFAGGMAVNFHGHRRTTQDVDIVICESDLQRFKDAKTGLGWVDKFEGSKNFRDAVTGTPVDALLSGGYPGDGKPKPIVFPDPSEVELAYGGRRPYLTLRQIIEMKIASGLTAPQRPRDFDDVIQLIRCNRLDEAFADRIQPYVAEKFRELWSYAQIDDEH